MNIKDFQETDETHLVQKRQKANKKLLHINGHQKDISKSSQNYSYTSPISQFGERLINAFGHHMLASGGSPCTSGKPRTSMTDRHC